MYNADVKGVIDRLIGYFSKGSVEVRGDGLVNISISESNIGSLEEIGYVLAVEVVRDFSCVNCKSLKGLRGSPRKVYGDFDCSRCDNLESLEGGPMYVKGDFFCMFCDKLRDLRGSPRVVKGDFSCRFCDNLESLDGGPRKVGGDFNCRWCINLKEIKFDVERIEQNLNCIGCEMLEYIDEDVVSKVGKKVYVKDCKNVKNMSRLKKKFGEKIDRRYKYV